MEICNNPEVLRVILYIKIILKLIFIIVPIGLIVMTAIDLFKNVIAVNDNDMKKNVSILVKRFIYCIVVFFVPTIVSLVVSIINHSLDTTNSYLLCITNAETKEIDQKAEEYAKARLDEALLENSYTKIDDAKTYINKVKDEKLREELDGMADRAKDAIVEEIRAKEQDEENAVRVTKVNNNSKYYYYNLEAPDSKSDYTMYVDPDPNYVSRAVEVTEAEKAMILSTITGEMGACKAGAVHTAQTIRDSYLYLSVFDKRFLTITGLITYAFSPSYVYANQTSENAEWAYNYVFVEGNSFYPRKFVGQRGFVVASGHKALGYYEVLQLRTHYDGKGTKTYITDPTYMYGYNIGNSKLDSGGEYADYINPHAKVK